MANRLRRMVISKITLCGQGMNPDAHVTLWKAEPMAKKDEPTVESLQAELAKAQEQAKASEAVVKERDALKAKVAELEKPKEHDPLEKADPAVKARLEKAEADAKETREKLAKMQDASERRDVADIAKSLPLHNTTGFADRLLVLKRVLTPEQFEAQMQDFRAQENQRAEVDKLFTEIGAGGDVPPESFEGQVDKMARAILEKSNGQLTYHQAYSQAMDSAAAKLAWGESTVERITKSKGS